MVVHSKTDAGSNLYKDSRNTAEQLFLLEFLESSHCPAHTMNFYQLDGYLRGISCSPGPALRDDYISLIFNDQSPSYNENSQHQVIESIRNLLSFHVEQLFQDRCELPFSTAYPLDPERRVNMEQWARGFMRGYIYWQDEWSAVLDEPLGEEASPGRLDIADCVDQVLHVISVIADIDFALQRGTHPDELASIFNSLPEVLINYGRVARALNPNAMANNMPRRSLPRILHTAQDANEPRTSIKTRGASKARGSEEVTGSGKLRSSGRVRRPAGKTGRNAPCPCGSSKKFKQCCLH